MHDQTRNSTAFGTRVYVELTYLEWVSNELQVAIRDTLCVVLHYGDEQDTLDCLASLSGAEFLEVVVVDNDPRQDFVLPAKTDGSVHVVQSGGHMGFAQANNFGVKTCRKKYHRHILILNNDTVAPPNSLYVLRETIENSDVGMVGPVMPYFDEPDTIWAAGGKISRWLVTIDGIRKIPDKKLAAVDYLPGAAFLTRLDLWDKIGGLPEKYFLAFEEAEYALEVKNLGYRVVVDRDATILHKVGMSSDRQAMYFYNTVRNRMRFGEYILGSRFGRLWGAISGLSRSVSLKRIRLWFRALTDEVRGVPLSRDTLQKIRSTYGVN